MKGLFLASAATLSTSAAATRNFTVYNACSFTIWPAIYTDPSFNTAIPDHPTGWEAPPNSRVTFFVPDKWAAGRIWASCSLGVIIEGPDAHLGQARRNCNFNHETGAGSCLTGGCNGGLLCDGAGTPPATLTEFTLNGDGNRDFYDVSLEDGYNLPVRIDNNIGCGIASCPVDLNPGCPAPLQGPFDSSGLPVGCKSACVANLDGHPENSPNCCTGDYAVPSICPASRVAYYDYFKQNCRNAFVYRYDNTFGPTLPICSGLPPEYTITFCPPS